jgi:hypothetical protein
MKLPVALLSAVALAFPMVAARADVANGDRDVPLLGATILRVNISGDVRFTPDAAVRTVAVHADSKNAPSKFSLSATRTGSRLTLAISGPQRAVLPFGGASGTAYEIVYPAHLKLDVREYAGDVSIDRPVAPVDVYDAQGDLRVDGAQSSVTAEANYGDIVVSKTRGAVDVAADTGDITVDLAPDWAGDSVRLQAAKGDVRLNVPPAFRGKFDVSAGQGSISNALRYDPNGIPVFIVVRTGDVTVTTRSPR